MKHRKLSLIVFLCLVVGIPVIFFSFFTPYKRIERYVMKSLGGKLEHSCNYYLEKGDVNPYGLETTEVAGIYGDTIKIVQFEYSGVGMRSDTKRYGYYYSPDDIPVPYCNENYALTETADGEWTWIGEGDSGGIIKKIRDHVYYFEAWF